MVGISTSARGGRSVHDEGTSSRTVDVSRRLVSSDWPSRFGIPSFQPGHCWICPDRLGVDSIRHKGEEVATEYWGAGGGGLWGHTVIFAGDRRLKVREGGFPRSRTRMVEGCTEETCCFPLFPCAWLSTCPPPESRPCGPYCLAARNSQWLSQPHRIVYANTPPQPKPLGRACVAHWNVRDQTSCGTNACCSADHLPCRTPL